MDGEILGKTKLNITRRSLKKEATYHLMLLPGVLLTFVFCYIPIFGLTMAFQNFKPAFGLFGPQEWVGLNNLLLLFKQPDIYQILFNTIFISVMKGIFGIIVPVVVALMLNEIRECGVKKGIQTIIYLPHFISWVVIASMLVNVLSPGTGIVNIILSKLNLEEIFFLGDDKVFPWVLIVSDIWKEFGYGSIVYLAAIVGIDPTLYEAAKIDGANKFEQIWHITLPGIRGMIALLAMLSLGNILNAGFDQVYNLLNNAVLSTGQILDTYIYDLAFGGGKNYSLSAMAGLFKSTVGFMLISLGYYLSYKFADYKLF